MSKHKGAHASAAFPAPAARTNPLLWGYGFGAALIGMGLLVLSIALGSALHSATRGVHKLSLPASTTLALKEGLYVGILPAPKTGPAPTARDVEVTLTEENGTIVPTTPFPPEAAQANAKVGTSLFQADVPYEGRYKVDGVTLTGPGPVEFLLVHESLSRNPSNILVGVILMAVLGGFGVYILALTHRRSKAFKNA
jgi:hypothetical protein